MRRIGLLFLALFVVTPATARDFKLTVLNRSAQAVQKVNAFGFDENGQIIDDNLGGITEPIPPGGKALVPLTALTRCETLSVFIVMADGEELNPKIDLCRFSTIRVD